jgi:hypothetical protein
LIIGETYAFLRRLGILFSDKGPEDKPRATDAKIPKMRTHEAVKLLEITRSLANSA